MHLEVRRDTFTTKSTGGQLFINGHAAGYTLEPPVLDLPVKPRAIPAGTYKLTIEYSPKHGRFLPKVKDVPGFEDIEIHIGNFPKDTLGCLLIGETRGEDEVLSSTPEFDEVYRQISEAYRNGEQVDISYTELAPVAA